MSWTFSIITEKTYKVTITEKFQDYLQISPISHLWRTVNFKENYHVFLVKPLDIKHCYLDVQDKHNF